MVNTGEKDWRLKVAEEWGRYVVQLNRAHKFHVELGNFYHPKTYAHWGADDKQKAWHKVSWQIQGLREISSGLQAKQPSSEKIDAASLQRDQMAGWAEILDKSSAGDVWVRNAQGVGVIRRSDGNYYRAKLSSQDQTGDATVPAHSSRAPEPYVSFFAEMQGFEHQNSYKSLRVKAVTFYSVMAIAAQAPKMS